MIKRATWMALSFAAFIVSAYAETPVSISETASLDILTDYDRDLWAGPEGWSDEQWQWKKRLKWDKSCDYVGEVEVHPLSNGSELVQVMCTPGAYQPAYYLFIYEPQSTQSTPLLLGDERNTDDPKIINGVVSFDDASGQLTITSLSRGTGDCGVYRIYNIENNASILRERRVQECSEASIHHRLDPKDWPLSP